MIDEKSDAGPDVYHIPWPDPTADMLETPIFGAIWNCIKTWDINVPTAYEGYCSATGNHVRAILDAIGAQSGPIDYLKTLSENIQLKRENEELKKQLEEK